MYWYIWNLSFSSPEFHRFGAARHPEFGHHTRRPSTVCMRTADVGTAINGASSYSGSCLAGPDDCGARCWRSRDRELARTAIGNRSITLRCAARIELVGTARLDDLSGAGHATAGLAVVLHGWVKRWRVVSSWVQAGRARVSMPPRSGGQVSPIARLTMVRNHPRSPAG